MRLKFTGVLKKIGRWIIWNFRSALKSLNGKCKKTSQKHRRWI
jgi:hypothetical protein